ncbi:UDP-N-acetylglucosamine--LPS N-acetylglucosamine transferase [Deltaproteobacteria bacterium IMCC39524]|nr:UDP-N-acetylglucosamine--LPS N-acetylglucosamine transferase [Deltaproteobacteria bacterium IMCC39524]
MNNAKRIMLVSSSGGHWLEMMCLLSAFDGFEKIFVTTDSGYKGQVEGAFFTVPDASMWNKFRLVHMAMKVLYVILRTRPDVIISTGAAPGFFALFFGKKLGLKTIWVDSIANAEKLSLSGSKVGVYADLWLTQWEHLSRAEGPFFEGAVL